MTEADIEIIIERAREKFPDATPRINQPVKRKQALRERNLLACMTHTYCCALACSFVRTKFLIIRP